MSIVTPMYLFNRHRRVRNCFCPPVGMGLASILLPIAFAGPDGRKAHPYWNCLMLCCGAVKAQAIQSTQQMPSAT